MRIEEQPKSDLPTSLFLVFSVILTVLVALFLAFSDELQTRLPSPIQPTAIAQEEVQIINPSPAVSATPNPFNNLTPTAATTTPTSTFGSIIAEVDCNNRPANWEEVIVGPEDTLYSLSIRYGATIGEIVQANCLETTAVFSGMTIYLPQTFPTREPCGPPSWWDSYIVRPGETLFILAQRHGTTVYAIKQANCMVDSRIFAGRSLYLPPIPVTIPPPPTIAFPTNTPMATATTTATALPTPSSTSAVTPSPTSTSAVPSGTPSPTGTLPATNTPTSTATATPPLSPTVTPSTTPMATTTAVPTMTPTNTPTALPPTNTPLPTATEPPPPSATPLPTSTP